MNVKRIIIHRKFLFCWIFYWMGWLDETRNSTPTWNWLKSDRTVRLQCHLHYLFLKCFEIPLIDDLFHLWTEKEAKWLYLTFPQWFSVPSHARTKSTGVLVLWFDSSFMHSKLNRCVFFSARLCIFWESSDSLEANAVNIQNVTACSHDISTAMFNAAASHTNRKCKRPQLELKAAT